LPWIVVVISNKNGMILSLATFTVLWATERYPHNSELNSTHPDSAIHRISVDLFPDEITLLISQRTDRDRFDPSSHREKKEPIDNFRS
jgi:hypothetical protein